VRFNLSYSLCPMMTGLDIKSKIKKFKKKVSGLITARGQESEI
jgi:hypothetical protein